MPEIKWKPIAEYENYSVSNTGNIRNNATNRILKTYIRNGYYMDDSGKMIQYRSAKEASAETGIDNSSILKSCKSDKLKAGNIKWHYMSNS